MGPVRDKKASVRTNGKNKRRLPKKLFGVQGDDLVDADSIESSWFRVVERCSRQPHVGLNMRIGFGTTWMMKPSEKTKLVAKRT